MKKKAIVLLSGGLDSLLTLAIAINKYYQPFPLHLNYGQITQERELKAFNDILEHYKIENKLIVYTRARIKGIQRYFGTL